VVRSFSVGHARQLLRRAMHMERADSVRNMLDDELGRAGLGELVLK
jgi:hypothetical protein